jgi:micrococcal nuclease
MPARRSRFIRLGLLLIAVTGLATVVFLRTPPRRDGPAGAIPDPPLARMQAVPASPSVVRSGWRVCEHVIDGDTIVLDGEEHVRLIGVDTPEKNDERPGVRQLARQASSFTLGQVAGRKVRLEYDQTRYDKYHRTLAYVYLEDGSMLNAEIIRRGYGFAYVRFPFRYMAEFRAYERAAREGAVGLWRTPAGQDLKATGRRTRG